MNLLAYLFVVLKSIVYGSTFFFTGRLTESVDVLDTLALRFLLSFVVLWLLKLTRVMKIDVGVKTFLKPNKHTPFLKTLLLAALFEPVLYMLFETIGVSETTGVTAAVIVSLAPAVNVIFESVVLKEKCTPLVKLFLAFGMMGAVYIAVKTDSSDGENSLTGIIFLFASVVVGGLFLSFSRKSSFHFSSGDITYVSCALGAAVFNSINVVRHIINGTILHYFNPYLVPENLVGFVFLGVVSTIIATAMNNYALSKLRLSVISAFGGLSTLFAVIMGVVFNGERLEYFHYIGFFFILVRMVGVSILSMLEENRAKSKQ